MRPQSTLPPRLAVWIFLALLCWVEVWAASTTKEQLEQEIRATADRHEKAQHPMDTATVLSIYAGHENLMTRPEMAHLYEAAYFAARERNAPGILARLLPAAGWVVAIIAIAWGIFKSQLEKLGGILVERFFAAVRRQFAGLRYIRNANLRRYCACLIERYSKLKVPFTRRELVLQDIYVPLRVAETRSNTSDIDAHEAVRKYRRLVITGNPGAGKTVLLSYIALSFARTGRSNVAANVVPLLFPLHRIREAHDKPLREHLGEELGRCGMPRAHEFLDDALRTGRLMLLLDGLDEVSRERRSRVVEGIRDFVEQAHPDCRVIVTCRTAVYNNDFFGFADEHLVISDFVDYQIISFLQPWKNVMPSGRSIEHLIETLRDRPRILALARNPLQLTMISSLYAEEYEQFTLPHSRTEFYERSTQLFLDRWHNERNRYSKPDKAAVLEHLGLHLHVTGGTSSRNSDKRSIPLEVVLAEINKVLPRLNLDPIKDCQLLLDEIVDRSGLLMRIDSGERFQFAHLTIQEYYAAQSLAQTPDLLLTYYRSDPQHWREVLRLWCGLDHDCSELVAEIFTFDRIMSLECVADAQRISDEVATTVTDYFQDNVDEQIIASHANVREAYAAVASSPRPRGRVMLEFLSVALGAARDDKLRQAIAETLSATNLSSAAAILFGAREDHPTLTPALTSMGDLAVIALSPLVEAGNITAIDDLFTIGTPNAATTLVPRLWDDRETIANRAAWALASLLTRREVKQALSNYPLTSQIMASPQDAWVWAPFAKPEDGSLRFIIAQISKHLTTADSAPDFVHHRPLEPRLTAAVAFVARHLETLHITKDSAAWTTTTLARLRQVLGISSDKEIASSVEKTLQEEISGRKADEVWEAILRDVPVKSAVGCMLHSLPINLISEMASRVMRAGAFELKEEWRRMHQPPPKRWWSRAIPPVGAAALMILLLPAFLLLIPTIWVQTSGWSWQRIVTVVIAILVLPGCAAWILPVVKYRELLEQVGWLRKKNTLLAHAGRACVFLLGPFLAVFSFVIGTLITALSRTEDAVGIQLFSLSCTLLCAPALLAAVLAAFKIGGLSWIGWSAAYFLVMGILAFLGDWKSSLEAKISNPLRGVRFDQKALGG